MTKKVASCMGPGSHGSTFGGNPLAMSVGNAVLDQILKKGFLKNVQTISKYFYDELCKLQSEFPSIIKEVRGKGLLIGIKVTTDQNLFIKKLLENKLLTIRAAENVVRLLPPLNVKKENIEEAIVILRKVCKNFK
jgi:acetylornithine/N-succinyldiaminopimelate aminotransferase